MQTPLEHGQPVPPPRVSTASPATPSGHRCLTSKETVCYRPSSPECRWYGTVCFLAGKRTDFPPIPRVALARIRPGSTPRRTFRFVAQPRDGAGLACRALAHGRRNNPQRRYVVLRPEFVFSRVSTGTTVDRAWRGRPPAVGNPASVLSGNGPCKRPAPRTLPIPTYDRGAARSRVLDGGGRGCLHSLNGHIACSS